MHAVKLILSTFFGVGNLRIAPGTWGSAAGLAAGYLLIVFTKSAGVDSSIPLQSMLPPDFQQVALSVDLVLLAAALVTGLLMIWSGDAAISAWGDDPGKVVLDEVSGMLLMLSLIGLQGEIGSDAGGLAAAFLLFRILDILKPFGIHRLQKLKGGLGILADDLAAALLGAFLFLSAGMLLTSLP